MNLNKIREVNQLIDELTSDFQKLEEDKIIYAKAISKHYAILAKLYREHGVISKYDSSLSQSLRYRLIK